MSRILRNTDLSLYLNPVFSSARLLPQNQDCTTNFTIEIEERSTYCYNSIFTSVLSELERFQLSFTQNQAVQPRRGAGQERPETLFLLPRNNIKRLTNRESKKVKSGKSGNLSHFPLLTPAFPLAYNTRNRCSARPFSGYC